MCACFLTLWSCLLGIYVLLLKAALDTDEKATALWIFFVFGVPARVDDDVPQRTKEIDL
jgi:hypothetical protein